MLKLSLRKIRDDLHTKILSLRSMEVRLMSPEFQRLWESSDEEKREEVFHIVEFEGMGLDPKSQLDKWVLKHQSRIPAEMTYRELKARAESIGIRNYSRMVKIELIAAIEKREKQ